MLGLWGQRSGWLFKETNDRTTAVRVVTKYLQVVLCCVQSSTAFKRTFMCFLTQSQGFVAAQFCRIGNLRDVKHEHLSCVASSIQTAVIFGPPLFPGLIGDPKTRRSLSCTELSTVTSLQSVQGSVFGFESSAYGWFFFFFNSTHLCFLLFTCPCKVSRLTGFTSSVEPSLNTVAVFGDMYAVVPSSS